MSKEYIEKEALLARYDAEHKGPAGRARTLIEEAPAADVVPVVRCKDCKHYSYSCCSHLDHEYESHYQDYYCADGERREAE